VSLRGKDSGKLYPAGDLVCFDFSGAPGRPTRCVRDRDFSRIHHRSHLYLQTIITCELVNPTWAIGRFFSAGAIVPGDIAPADEQNFEFLDFDGSLFDRSKPEPVRTVASGLVDMYRTVMSNSKWIIPTRRWPKVDVFDRTKEKADSIVLRTL